MPLVMRTASHNATVVGRPFTTNGPQVTHGAGPVVRRRVCAVPELFGVSANRSFCGSWSYFFKRGTLFTRCVVHSISGCKSSSGCGTVTAQVISASFKHIDLRRGTLVVHLFPLGLVGPQKVGTIGGSERRSQAQRCGPRRHCH